MDDNIRHTFSKEEKLCGKTNIEKLLARGKRGGAGCLRYCWFENPESSCNRILVSVPKKFFKRAVKRNLLKRRIRESWRLQKHLLSDKHFDILMTYSTKEIHEYAVIHNAVNQIIGKLSKVSSSVSQDKTVK